MQNTTLDFNSHPASVAKFKMTDSIALERLWSNENSHTYKLVSSVSVKIN